MSESLIPLPKTSLEKLLRPVNRLTPSCVLRVEDDLLYTLCSATDTNVILYAWTKLPISLEKKNLNIYDIKKLLTGLECLGNDGEFKIVHNENNIVCKSTNTVTGDNTHIKYHLVDDNLIKESPINIQLIKTIVYDTSFEISLPKIKQIMSAYSYVDDINKIYFYTKNNNVYADIDDKDGQNKNNVTLLVSNSYDGSPLLDPIAVKIEIFKLLISSKSSIRVRFSNEKKVFIFESEDDDNIFLKYIISSLVK